MLVWQNESSRVVKSLFKGLVHEACVKGFFEFKVVYLKPPSGLFSCREPARAAWGEPRSSHRPGQYQTGVCDLMEPEQQEFCPVYFPDTGSRASQ